MDKKPLVSICCLTYNHEKYIHDAIEGFLMQKANFEFEILIHDDASTDGTTEIIKEYEKKYPGLIKPIYQTENQWSKGIKPFFKDLFPKAKGKYIALCEGDDYWVDPYKLQKQVDFMEANPKYGVVYTGIYRLFQNSNKLFPSKIHDSEYKFEDLILFNPVYTLTTCIRKDLLDQYIHEINPELKGWYSGDYPMWLYMSERSIIKSLPIRTAVYRVLEESASNSKNPCKLLYISKYRHSVRTFYLKYFNKPKKLKHEVDLISYREPEMNAVKCRDVEYLKTIYKFYLSNKYFALAFFVKLYIRFPYLFNITFFFERVLIKLHFIKTIKL